MLCEASGWNRWNRCNQWSMNNFWREVCGNGEDHSRFFIQKHLECVIWKSFTSWEIWFEDFQRTKSLLKLVPAQHDLIWVMLLSIFFSYTLFFITCICRILFKHRLLSFDLTHWAELCFQGQWWVGGMTSDRFCWLKGLFETSHFEKRSQKRSEDQMYDLRKNKHPLLSRHDNRFQMDNLSPFPLVFSNQFFDPLLPSRWSCGASRAFRSKTGRTRFALVAPRRNDGAKNRNLRAHLGGWKSKILRSRC